MSTNEQKEKLSVGYKIFLIALFVFGVWFWIKSLSEHRVAISFVESASTDDGWFTFSILNISLPLFFCLLAVFAVQWPLIVVKSLLPKKVTVLYKIFLSIVTVMCIYGLAKFMMATVSEPSLLEKLFVYLGMTIIGLIFFMPTIHAIFSDNLDVTREVMIRTIVNFAVGILLISTAMYFTKYTVVKIILMLLGLGVIVSGEEEVITIVIKIF